MYYFKHDYNKVIEACAELLHEKMGFNPAQVIRHFQIFSMDYFKNTTKVPEEELENWYYLRETLSHTALIFNYETKEFKLIDPEYKWIGKFIEEFQKSEEQLAKDNELYIERMEKIIDSSLYQKLQPLIKWYFSYPNITLRNVLHSPSEFILIVLKKYSKGLKIKGDADRESIRDDLFEAYHYEERKKEKEINKNIK